MSEWGETLRLFYGCLANNTDPHGMLEQLDMFESAEQADEMVVGSRQAFVAFDVVSSATMVELFRIGYELDGEVSDQVFDAEITLIQAQLDDMGCTPVIRWETFGEALAVIDIYQDRFRTLGLLAPSCEVDLGGFDYTNPHVWELITAVANSNATLEMATEAYDSLSHDDYNPVTAASWVVLAPYWELYVDAQAIFKNTVEQYLKAAGCQV